MNYRDFNLDDWIGHISGVIEDETTLDGNEMRDLVEFLTTLKQYPTTKNDLEIDCISRADALRVAKNEYLRGWHDALCKALSEKYSIHCEEGKFSVIQEETITGLGLSMNCAAGKDVKSYMSTIPRTTPIRTKGHWKLVQRGKKIDVCCSNCKAVRIKEYAYNYTIDQLDKEDVKECFESDDMRYCPYCGSDNREVVRKYDKRRSNKRT